MRDRMDELFSFPDPVNEKVVVGSHTAADVILVAFVGAAGLESVFALCLGCRVYAQLERAGVVPPCEECADISSRLAA